MTTSSVLTSRSQHSLVTCGAGHPYKIAALDFFETSFPKR
jgi:hypothetical protein